VRRSEVVRRQRWVEFCHFWPGGGRRRWTPNRCGRSRKPGAASNLLDIFTQQTRGGGDQAKNTLRTLPLAHNLDTTLARASMHTVVLMC